MTTNKKTTLLASAILMAVGATGAMAKVSEDEAGRLGNELTPMGAEAGANADGTIPAWTGGITSAPSGYKAGDHHPDPFADDQIKFTITADNYEQYREQLTPGQEALFKAYPEEYRMHVYPTRRSASYPDFVYDATRKNAVNAELVEGGNGLKGASIGVPFPIAQNGLEAVWNHIARYRGAKIRRHASQASPQASGSYVLVKILDELYLVYGDPEIQQSKLYEDNVLAYFKQQVTSPARLAGTALLVHETIDQVKDPRRAWTYNTGQRRVRRAPNVAYDAPGTASDGLRTTDDFDMYNGAPDRYNWKLVGKKEVYIPYNTYKLHSDQTSYEDILKPHVINQDLNRYELHRVWVVEATLKEGTSHQYGKRVFYMDEDSWQIALAELYDKRGDLWRVAMSHAVNYYDVPTLWSTLEAYYDLPSGRYLAIGLDNQEDMYDFNADLTLEDFTPAALRRSGRR